MLLVLHANWTSFIAFLFAQASQGGEKQQNKTWSCKFRLVLKENVTQMRI